MKINPKLLGSILLSFLITFSINLYLVNINPNLFLGNIQWEITLQSSQIAMIIWSIIWETGLLTAIFYWGSKKIFK